MSKSERSYALKRDGALVPDVLLLTNSFLTPQSSMSLRSVCKEWLSLIPRKVSLSVQSWEGQGTPRDVLVGTEGHLFPQTIQIEEEMLDSIDIKLKWKDQGWGGRKGLIVLKLLRADGDGNVSEIAQCIPFGLAEHDWTFHEIILTKSHEIIYTAHEKAGNITKAQNGDIIQFHRHVGGGGGHHLYIKDFEAIFSFRKSNKL